MNVGDMVQYVEKKEDGSVARGARGIIIGERPDIDCKCYNVFFLRPNGHITLCKYETNLEVIYE